MGLGKSNTKVYEKYCRAPVGTDGEMVLVEKNVLADLSSNSGRYYFSIHFSLIF